MHEARFSTGMSGNAVPPFAYHFAVYAMVISGERPRRDLAFVCHIAAERQPRIVPENEPFFLFIPSPRISSRNKLRFT